MARGNLLNTKTINFLELIGNGKTYRVPPYQRDYSWEEEQWEDLWSDLLELRDAPEDRHYMGALVVQARSDRDFLIIDGQQRVATLTLLALAIIAQLEELAKSGADAVANRERSTALRNRFVGEKDPVSLLESSKLFLNATDNGFFQDHLVQIRPPINPRSLPRSNMLLWKCHTWFVSRIAGIPELSGSGEQLAFFLNETIARQLLFIQISVEDELNAYTVFETLNARGLELSATDLLKNYLFSRIRSDHDRDALQRRWLQLIGTVRQERFPEFLRFHLQCELPRVRSQRLFKLVRERVSDAGKVFELLDSLAGRAELFSALGDATHGYWIDRPESRPYVRALLLFGVRQPTPLLFACWERFEALDFARTLKLVTALSFRYSVIGALNPNELEPVYHRAAKAVLDGSAKGPGAVFDYLRPVYVADEKFRQDFSLTAFPTRGNRKKLVKYILSHLEAQATGRVVDTDTDPGTVEHILPENPDASWEDMIPAEHWADWVYRLGNLTLLESNFNRDIGNGAYPRKAAAYRGSSYRVAVEVVDSAPDEWTTALIEERQRRMADRAVHIWRSDFE